MGLNTVSLIGFRLSEETGLWTCSGGVIYTGAIEMGKSTLNTGFSHFTKELTEHQPSSASSYLWMQSDLLVHTSGK